MKTTTKKGIIGIGQLSSIILLLIIIGLMVIVAIRVQSGVKTGITVTDTGTVVNESQVLGSGGNLTNLTFNGYSGLPNQHLQSAVGGFKFINGTRATGTLVYANNNFTVSGDTVGFSATVDAGINNSLINYTYIFTFDKGSEVYNSSVNVMEGTTNVSEGQGLLGTLIIFGIIIGLVVTAFMIKGVV